MGPPSQLTIATQSLNRVVKEEKSYHQEYKQQESRIAKLEQGGGDENAEYQLRQERKALEETRVLFPQLKQNIQEALSRLKQQLEEDKGPGDQSTPEDITKAKEAIASALTAVRESS